MEFRILGPLEVLGDGRQAVLGGARQRALLALLVIHANETLATERLIDELWGERPPASAAKTLQVQISRLRKTLGATGPHRDSGMLVTRGAGYELRVEPERIDSYRFERLIAEGRRELIAGHAQRALSLLGEALSLWRGPPLAEFVYERFAQGEAGRLDELRVGAVEELIEAKLGVGRHADVVGELEQLIREHPYRERLRAQLMLALYRCDRQAEALQAYQEARRALVEELGIEPGQRLRELERAILAQDQALALPDHADTGAPVESPTVASAAVFVGRGAELAELIGGLGDSVAGRGRLYVLIGEPGVGKSRLAEELARHARGRGARVLIGRCWEAGGAPAFWPWVQLLRSYIRARDRGDLVSQLGPGAVEIAPILPEVHELIPGLPRPAAPEPEGSRFRLFDATAELLRRASEERPLVLILDDVHAADTPSLLMLQFLARELGSMRVLVLAAMRDVDPVPDEPLTAMLAELAREPVTHRISLSGLSERDVAEYVQLTAADIASAELAAELHAETDGNPLFVTETVRLLLLEGLRPEPAGAIRLVIPQSVRDVISRRLAHLSAPCNQMLALASVLGREFVLELLARVGEVSVDELLETLDEAMSARVIGEVPGVADRLRFAHVVIRDTLYERLTAARRVKIHRLALAALEALYGEHPGAHLAELAHHAIAARDVEKAVRYAWRAADRALALLAYEEAARLYEMALDALEQHALIDDATRCELLLALGEARARGGDLELAKQTFAGAAAVARALSASQQLARAALGYGGRVGWLRAGTDHRLIPMLEEALDATSGDNPLRARLLARLAGALRDHPAAGRRAKLCDEAVNIARRIGDLRTLAYALEGTYAALSLPQDVDAWLAASRELTQLADGARDNELAFQGHLGTYGAMMMRGDLSGADTALSAAAATALKLRQPAQLSAATSARAMRAAFAGRFEDAKRLYEQFWGSEGILAARGGFDESTFYLMTRLQSWALRRELGGLAELREPLERYALEHPGFFMFQCLLTNTYAQLGDQIAARAQLDSVAANDFAELGVGAEWFVGASLLAEPCAFLGEATYAARLCDALLPYGDHTVMSQPEFNLGSGWRYLGILAATCSRSQEATRHFERALEMNAHMGARPALAHTQDDYASILRARDKGDDRSRAQDLVTTAVNAYWSLGMKGWAERAREWA